MAVVREQLVGVIWWPREGCVQLHLRGIPGGGVVGWRCSPEENNVQLFWQGDGCVSGGGGSRDVKGILGTGRRANQGLEAQNSLALGELEAWLLRGMAMERVAASCEAKLKLSADSGLLGLES